MNVLPQVHDEKECSPQISVKRFSVIRLRIWSVLESFSGKVTSTFSNRINLIFSRWKSLFTVSFFLILPSVWELILHVENLLKVKKPKLFDMFENE